MNGWNVCNVFLGYHVYIAQAQCILVSWSDQNLSVWFIKVLTVSVETTLKLKQPLNISRSETSFIVVSPQLVGAWPLQFKEKERAGSWQDRVQTVWHDSGISGQQLPMRVRRHDTATSTLRLAATSQLIVLASRHPLFNTWRPSVPCHRCTRLERSSALSVICTVTSNLQTISKDTPILSEFLFVVLSV